MELFKIINKNLLICLNIIKFMGIFSFFKKDKSQDKKEEKKESHIEIDRENCKACQRCVSVCPNNSFVIVEGKSSLKDDYICRDCKVCVAACPNECINFVDFNS